MTLYHKHTDMNNFAIYIKIFHLRIVNLYAKIIKFFDKKSVKNFVCLIDFHKKIIKQKRNYERMWVCRHQSVH